MSVKIGILEGDGIGPEIVTAALRVLDGVTSELSSELDLIELPFGWDGYEECGNTLPARTIESLAGCDGCIVGPIMVGEYPADDEVGDRSPVGALRTRFDLYGNIRPIRSYTDIGPPGMDVAVIRQNTEGFYADRNMVEGSGQFKPTDDVALSARVVTRYECRRIAKMAFSYAERNGYQTVTAVHKANVFTHAGEIFLTECEQISDRYPDIQLNDSYVDAFAMDVVINPGSYDVVVTTNMFGDILSDEIAGIVGSPGLAPGLNVGDEIAMAQATHGAAPDIAGQGSANPLSMILSTALLLKWFAHSNDQPDAGKAAEQIETAVADAIHDGTSLTPDLGGTAKTDEFTDAVTGYL